MDEGNISGLHTPVTEHRKSRVLNAVIRRRREERGEASINSQRRRSGGANTSSLKAVRRRASLHTQILSPLHLVAGGTPSAQTIFSWEEAEGERSARADQL